MFHLTKASVSCSNLSTMATYEHANPTSSSTSLQSIGGSEGLGEPGRSSSAIPGPTVPEDPRAGITSPEVVLLTIPKSVPHTTRSWGGPLASWPGRGWPHLPRCRWHLATCHQHQAPPKQAHSVEGWHCSHPASVSPTPPAPTDLAPPIIPLVFTIAITL
jgi:hypothetical protein